MKRRSAGPFTVEIKHSRLSPISSLNVFGDRRAIPQRSQAVVDARRAHSLAFEPREHAKVPVVSKSVEQKARRLLPALTPIFAVSEPERTEVPKREGQAPVKVKARRAPRTSQPVKPVAPEPAIQMAVSEPKTFAPEQATAIQPQPPEAQSSPQHVGRRRGDWRTRPDRSTLPPGERWKHRLPRIR